MVVSLLSVRKIDIKSNYSNNIHGEIAEASQESSKKSAMYVCS